MPNKQSSLCICTTGFILRSFKVFKQAVYSLGIRKYGFKNHKNGIEHPVLMKPNKVEVRKKALFPKNNLEEAL